ncbi:MAG: hypothetical protein P8J20_02030 [Novosphingobium sp.]|nr:hypothetical protein [Novosphingobium sp.]
MNMASFNRRVGIVIAAGLVLFLSACLLSPGKFISALDIRKDGSFSFSYNGELVFEPLTKKPNSGAGQEDEYQPMTPECYDDQDGEEVPCSAEFLAKTAVQEEKRKAEWEEMQKEQKEAKAEREKQQAASAKSFFGGIDASDPKAGEALAEKLRRQAGWSKVEYQGNGVFHVEFAATGSLGHDFTFPTIEGFAMANAFVQVGRRNDGTVRINAPGFSPPASPMGMGGMMPMSGGGGSPKSEAPKPEGQFTIRTDAAILANNTDEGPKADQAGRQRLDWDVSTTTPSAPTALLRLSN